MRHQHYLVDSDGTDLLFTIEKGMVSFEKGGKISARLVPHLVKLLSDPSVKRTRQRRHARLGPEAKLVWIGTHREVEQFDTSSIIGRVGCWFLEHGTKKPTARENIVVAITKSLKADEARVSSAVSKLIHKYKLLEVVQ